MLRTGAVGCVARVAPRASVAPSSAPTIDGRVLRHRAVTVALAQDEAHLWWVRPEELPEAQLVEAMAWLTPDERTRQQRYLFAKHRLINLATRALVRSVLSRYTDLPPEALVFAANEWGRPELVPPSGVKAPRFNLSNTDGLVVMLLAADRDVGVDVERVDRRATIEVADRFFAPDEVVSVRTQPEHQQGRRFFEHWTLKESYIKARGMGLAIPLQRFGFELALGKPVKIHIDASLGDDAASWQFEQCDLDEAYLVAATIRRRDGHDAVLTLHHATHLCTSGDPPP